MKIDMILGFWLDDLFGCPQNYQGITWVYSAKYPFKVIAARQVHAVLNRLEVYPRDVYDAAMEELKKYHRKPAKKPVGNKLEVLGRRFRVAYDEAMKYGVGVMMNRRFPILVALCDGRPLEEKIAFMRATIEYNNVRFIALDLIICKCFLHVV
ncbi:uncharacterized protein LOC115728150 isoform X2 [Rhodamnia argentea]|uniref:Uncharacterized protein LOC115728150 isoform X2 n=1 Tax=Rhodamnia argentea TaxID=178133 RepID=A0ABM3HRB7_9MYRT|nr:uncharacterized protein LOC115728150 isoform X2 [Rhodamnia argentea]